MTHSLLPARARAPVVALFVGAVACSAPAAPAPHDLPIFVAAEHAATIEQFAAMLPAELDAGIVVAADPVAAMAASSEGTRRVAIVVDPARCEGCFRLEAAPGGWVVRGDAPLGVQYGLAALLESMGVRFFHPQRTFVPAALSDPDPAVLTRDEAPEIAQRGLHLHTLHPIEAHFDFWAPSDTGLEEARRTLHWIVANRGNFVTYTGLDDVVTSAPNRERWLAHTHAILDDAHRRGVRVGMGIQLFGGANLQHAFDLVEAGGDPATSIPQRLDLFRELPFDSIQLSFGEFSGEDPATFVATLDLAWEEIHARWPEAEVTATIHVGNFPSTQVTYMGETQIYYFLVRYARSPIVPWVHTVMYYDLFEDAGGAYAHDEFDVHRDYLLARLEAGQDVAYHPESAYWIAFDDTIPTYLPLYARSRWLDLHEIRARSPDHPLGRQVVFSSGWEWGYWQNDWAVLRTSWRLPPAYEDVFAEMLAPLPRGPEVAAIVSAYTEAQHRALIEERLAAYLASTDATFAFGRMSGFWSQPLRPTVDEILAMDATARAAFRADVLERLDVLAADTRTADGALAALAVDDPWVDEIEDGVAIDLARTEFASAIWGAALAAAEGAPTDALFAAADAARDRARAIVDRRHAHLFDPDPAGTIAQRRRNATLYPFGYLAHAEALCHFERERAEVRNAVLGETHEIPGCAL